MFDLTLGSSAVRKLATIRATRDSYREIPFAPPKAREVRFCYAWVPAPSGFLQIDGSVTGRAIVRINAAALSYEWHEPAWAIPPVRIGST